MHWRGGTCEIIYLLRNEINCDLVSNIGVDEGESGMVDYVLDVGQITGHEVINTQHFMTLVNQAITEVGADEAAASSNYNFHRGDFEIYIKLIAKLY